MYILTGDQIRQWDEYTILHEPVSSFDLMERAAAACFSWLKDNDYLSKKFSIFCGKGNNGGDGLALARLLINQDVPVTIFILEFGNKGTSDFQSNLALLHELNAEIRFISSAETIPELPEDSIIIDALLGSGLNRPLTGLTEELVLYMNTISNEIIALDIPSGLPADESLPGNTVITANHTLAFQCYKPAFLMAENAKRTGEIHILDIRLHPNFPDTINTKYQFIDHDSALKIYRPRKPFTHKGSYGHALIIAGSYGKMGAAVLSNRACLHSGIGLLTAYSPRCGYDILQTSIPEAMVITDKNENFFEEVPEDLSNYDCVGIGPGLGTAACTVDMIDNLLDKNIKQLVIDADALNIISQKPSLFSKIKGCIITPHPKEFERLFGKADNDFDRLSVAVSKAAEFKITIILKGRFTAVIDPEGKIFFNTTGNPGMASGGSGDALTGILTSLLAQGYPTLEAAKFGVYLHGLAGDLAAKASSEESLSASQLIHFLGMAFRTFKVK